jgi:hypothetical protein
LGLDAVGGGFAHRDQHPVPAVEQGLTECTR